MSWRWTTRRWNEVDLLAQRGVKLLAEKVETASMYARVRALGFDVPRVFFSHDETYAGQRIRPNKLVLMQLLARINDRT